ncbi:retrovirus-related Pol polyprotein from transposon 297 [Elysia marginata]|uniref:Retrovirus-related Pol polyprotein from transposon 297 n=1 Tax=Elysia marginata TaxID=1093978 RepID=A0AAV4IRJ5_9GAST|nr:retrovirus-related Pol polyprotein from transposon 297 [Elysia marginata]
MKPFILSTDASDTAVGAILSQDYEDGKFPVIYLSRKLLPREQRYSVVERECLALVWAVKSLTTYLLSREFVAETDHAPLLYLNRAKSENGRLMR